MTLSAPLQEGMTLSAQVQCLTWHVLPMPDLWCIRGTFPRHWSLWTCAVCGLNTNFLLGTEINKTVFDYFWLAERRLEHTYWCFRCSSACAKKWSLVVPRGPWLVLGIEPRFVSASSQIKNKCLSFYTISLSPKQFFLLHKKSLFTPNSLSVWL